jgi:hypothetical protein
MRWFGETWGAPVNEECEHAPTPVGEQCLECERVINDGQQGVLLPYMDVEAAYHRLCFLRLVLPPEFHKMAQMEERARERWGKKNG